MKRITFLYIAEAYQCYHAAAIALDLAQRPDVETTTYYIDPEAPAHLERIRLAYGAPAMTYRRLRRSLSTRLLQSLRVFGRCKSLVLRDNASELNRYDAIFAVENSVAMVRRAGVDRPKLIYSPHGFGDRARGFLSRIASFDFVLLAGAKTENRMLRERLIRPGAYALTGSVKLETGARLRDTSPPLFEQVRPIVLYNAHNALELSSWPAFIEPMLAAFESQTRFNLVVAPHVKLFYRRSRRVRTRWEARSRGNTLVDTGSNRSLDMSYTAAADIYVGDISSQVYEFLSVLRPCVFLNPHRIAWQDDPSFAHWHLGDVVEDPADLMAAIEAAPARHVLYREKQAAMAAASLGSRAPGISRRAADAVMTFLNSSPARLALAILCQALAGGFELGDALLLDGL